MLWLLPLFRPIWLVLLMAKEKWTRLMLTLVLLLWRVWLMLLEAGDEEERVVRGKRPRGRDGARRAPRGATGGSGQVAKGGPHHETCNPHPAALMATGNAAFGLP